MVKPWWEDSPSANIVARLAQGKLRLKLWNDREGDGKTVLIDYDLETLINYVHKELSDPEGEWGLVDIKRVKPKA